MVLPRGSIEPITTNAALASLIRSVAGGNQQDMTALYDSSSRLIFGLLMHILKDAGAAEEVLLDVYTQVWRQAAQYDKSRGTPLAWLITIARSRAIDRLRSGHQERIRSQPLETISQRAGGSNVEEDANLAEMQTMVRASLGEIPPEQREVIELAYYGGMSHTEIAAKVGLPLGTVKTRTRLGMMKLREMLKPTIGGVL
ncbi:MAG: sigma-70 family RNA polymerase sigma factor [Acidobacteria bacterium]|nr:sigma-70 family RNA polymerase sigma factor [Acidobacteriota bacterium]